MYRRWPLVIAAGLDLGILVAGRPRFGELARGLGGPHAWVRDAGTDHVLVALASAASWAAALWLAFGLVAVAATTLPGAAGRFAVRASRRLLPGALRRLLAGSAGLGMLIAPVAAGAATQAGHVSPSPVASVLPCPTWPVNRPASALPSPAWPVNPPASALPAPHWPATPPHDPRSKPRGAARGAIRVHAGDSLWTIAARNLGTAATSARVAREWPRWYAANRSVIGPDAGLIQPGQVLHAPSQDYP